MRSAARASAVRYCLRVTVGVVMEMPPMNCARSSKGLISIKDRSIDRTSCDFAAALKGAAYASERLTVAPVMPLLALTFDLETE